MADKEIHHVKLHQGPDGWLFLLAIPGALAAMWWFYGRPILGDFDARNTEPYVLDLRGEEAPVTVDYGGRFEHIIVTITRADGKEIRLYAPDTGKLVGTYWESASADAASEEDESGGE
jgi:hypothetical protein